MKQKIFTHYKQNKQAIHDRLQTFKQVRKKGEKRLFEELAFCIFAANSSAQMGLKAQRLLKPVLHDGTLQDYKEKVKGNVRFYNTRSKYLYENKQFLQRNNLTLTSLINDNDKYQARTKLTRLKGMGMKTSSHYLRNVGIFGLAILDKHIRDIMNKLTIFTNADRPKTPTEYEEKEKKLQQFATEHNINIAALDLTLWSYKTGEILK